MKKVLASLVLAGLTAAAFAQTAAPAPASTPATPSAPVLKLNGYISTGVTAITNGVDKAVVGLWDDDTSTSVGRFKLIGDYSLGDEGLHFDLRSSGLGLSGSSGAQSSGFSNVVYLKSVYAYDTFLNGLFYTQAGVIFESSTRADSSATLRTSFTKETPGAILVARPLPGLTLDGAVVGLGTTDTTGLANAATGSDYTNLGDVPVAAGGSYTLPGVGLVLGQVLFIDTNTTFGAQAYNFGSAYAAVKVTAVPHLTAWVEGWLGGYAAGASQAISSAGANGLNDSAGSSYGKYLNDGGNDGLGIVAETINYNFADQGVSPLTAGIVALQYFYGNSLYTNGSTAATGSSVTPSLRFSPWASWNLGNGVIPKLMLSYASGAEIVKNSVSNYNSGGAFGDSGILDNYLNVYAPVDTAAVPNLNNVALFEVKPSVQFVVNPANTITLAYVFAASVGTEAVFFTDSTNAKSSATTNNVIQANYVFNF